MPRLIGALALALLLLPRPALAGDLTLRDVIELHRSGLGDDLLIAVIEADGGPFELGMADILDLRSDGLSERVIAALVRTRSRVAANTGTPVVQVQQVQQVTTLPVVVVVDDHDHGGPRPRPQPRGDTPTFQPGPGQIPPMVTTPPAATWTTRRDSGRNESASGEATSRRPAAAWVTPAAGEKKKNP